MRLYKRTYGLRQICNIAVYMVHSACTIHLLNLPEKTAKRDIIHGVKHLEEIAEDWLCARRTLSILSVLARKWRIDLPEEALTVLSRTDAKYGFFSTADVPSPKHEHIIATPPSVAASPAPTASSVTQSTFTAPPNQNRNQTPTQLHQSLYSYVPDTRSMPSTPPTSYPAVGVSTPISRNQASNRDPVSNNTGSINIVNERLISSTPYSRHPYDNISSPPRASVLSNTELPRNNSGVASEASGTMTRQVSPNTMFGSVDALVESQDWWLRDQANLAVGFDNWMGTGGDINGMSIPTTSGANGGIPSSIGVGSDPMAGVGAGFYMPSVNNGNVDGFGDDDWGYS